MTQASVMCCQRLNLACLARLFRFGIQVCIENCTVPASGAASTRCRCHEVYNVEAYSKRSRLNQTAYDRLTIELAQLAAPNTRRNCLRSPLKKDKS